MRRTVVNLSLAIGSAFFFLSILEIGTRLLWHSSVEDGHVGVILQGADREVVHEGIEYRTNSLGLRSREIDTKKTKGARRILALGDSFLWGDGLSEEDLVTAKMEKSLRAHLGVVDVVNAGMSGYNTHDELRALMRLAPIYEPDMVIVFFFTNDVLAEDSSGAPLSWRQNVKEFLRHKSRFFAYLYYVYKDRLSAKIGTPRFLLPQDYFNLNNSTPGWVAFKRSALQIRDYCAQHGLHLLFVIIPTLANLDERYPYAELRGAVVRFLHASHIDLIDLFNAFSPYRPSDLWVSLENPHWNRHGTAIAANEITAYVMRHSALQRPVGGVVLGKTRSF
jgi:hypothetical protein